MSTNNPNDPRPGGERLRDLLKSAQPKPPEQLAAEEAARLAERDERIQKSLKKSDFGLPPAQPGDLSEAIIDRQAHQARQGRSGRK